VLTEAALFAMYMRKERLIHCGTQLIIGSIDRILILKIQAREKSWLLNSVSIKRCKVIIVYHIFFIVSQDPGNYDDAPTEGIRRVLEIVTGQKIPRASILETDKIGTLSSNYLLEKHLRYS
jgi:hypothetical protein